MDELPINLDGGTGIGESFVFDPPASDRRAGDALVETGHRDVGDENRSHYVCHADFCKIISH